jgi:hypothetical protein
LPAEFGDDLRPAGAEWIAERAARREVFRSAQLGVIEKVSVVFVIASRARTSEDV